MSKRFAVIAINLAVAMVLIGGTTAFATMNKVVAINIDGQTTHIRTYAPTVGAILEAQGIRLQGGDKVSHQMSDFIGGGQTIKISYAKPVVLAVDGEITREVVYDRTVGDLLERLGVATSEDTFISHDLSRRISRVGENIFVSNPKSITVTIDGTTQKLTTAAPTALYLFRELGVAFDANDEANPGMIKPLAENQRVTLIRIDEVERTEEVDTDFDITYQDDPDLYKGETKVIKPGIKGKAKERVRVVLANGEVRDRVVLSSEPLKKPTAQLEARGTKPLPSVWDRLAKCESGGNWKINTGNGYYGGLQFSLSSWRAVGGKGYPHQASKEEQIKRAMILKENGGWGHWPGCSKKLGLR